MDLLRQRIFGLTLGYEDLNDHDTLRRDLAWQTALERNNSLASSPTLCRLEKRANRRAVVAFHEVLLAQFIASFATPPAELILDFDATDDRVHGRQEGRFFNGYYGDYCFLPLYVFCGEQLLVSYLRPSHLGAAQHSLAILKLLVQGLRTAWPEVKILLRGDSGFCRWRLFSWCERHGVDYLVGLAKNVRLAALAQPLIEQAEAAFVATGEKVRLFGWLDYGAGSWDKPRRVILKAEHTDQGKNPRYLVTSLVGDARSLYEEAYLRTGRDGKPPQGAAARALCRSHELPGLVGQLVPAAALGRGLRAFGEHPALGALRHGSRPRAGGHHPPQALEDRCRGHAQHQGASACF